jgi:hypothetical protein
VEFAKEYSEPQPSPEIARFLEMVGTGFDDL